MGHNALKLNAANFYSRDAKLHEICAYLNLLPTPKEGHSSYDKELLLEILVCSDTRFNLFYPLSSFHNNDSSVQISRHERRLSQIEALNDMPLYPTEQVSNTDTVG